MRITHLYAAFHFRHWCRFSFRTNTFMQGLISDQHKYAAFHFRPIFAGSHFKPTHLCRVSFQTQLCRVSIQTNTQSFILFSNVSWRRGPQSLQLYSMGLERCSQDMINSRVLYLFSQNAATKWCLKRVARDTTMFNCLH